MRRLPVVKRDQLNRPAQRRASKALQMALPYTCHWGEVSNPRPDAPANKTGVWICEYPYRTMRAQGPSEECAGCPIWEARCQAKRALAELTPELELVH